MALVHCLYNYNKKNYLWRRWPTFIGNLIPDDEEEFDKFKSRDKRHAPGNLTLAPPFHLLHGSIDFLQLML